MILKFNDYNTVPINEGLSGILGKLFPKYEWEKLFILDVKTTYKRKTFGIETDSGEIEGIFKISVDRKKKKVKAVAYFGNYEKEYNIDMIYNETPELEIIVNWSINNTDINIPLSDILLDKIGKKYIENNDISHLLSII